MPLRSMTGFGEAEAETASGSCRVEIRGVNNRYLETQIRLPRTLSNLEPKIKQQVSRTISRGSIIVLVTCENENNGASLSWDKKAVETYIGIFREIQQSYKLDGNISLSHLISFSDLIKNEPQPVDEKRCWRDIKPVLESALAAFTDAREAEAKLIVKDLKKNLREIARALGKVQKQAPVRQKKYFADVQARIEKLSREAVDPQRMATEIAIMADKMDISEETTRLAAHLKRFGEDLELHEPVGKRLTFLLQEMHREANTMGSKANDTLISHLTIGIKENIEKIREQVQNIE